MDAMHDDSVSWAITSETQLSEALGALLASPPDKPRTMLPTMLRPNAEQPTTYHVWPDSFIYTHYR